MQIGVISDTHNLLRPEVVDFLKQCNHIIHAGDVGSMEALKQLRAIAPLTVVRGNVDTGKWAETLPLTEAIELGDKALYIIHNLDDLDIDPEAAGFDVVIAGHSHEPEVRRKGGVTYLNPGSIGPRRFTLPISYASIDINDSEIKVDIHTIG
ncbi:MAG: metallophosphoesterase family protein [Thermodesulfobacteriota bacterium]